MVSIIVPVYNIEKYLEECLNSILNQSYEDFELILINDGSADKSGDICDEYKKNNFLQGVSLYCSTEDIFVKYILLKYRKNGIKNKKGYTLSIL